MKRTNLYLITILLTMLLCTAAAHASLPYEYWFHHDEADPWTVYLMVGFDEEIWVDEEDLSLLEIYPRGAGAETAFRPIVNLGETELIGNTLNVAIERLDPMVEEYELIIPPGVLFYTGYTQLDDFVISFETHNLTPGFRSVFTGITPLIDQIFDYNNAPRDVNVVVPPKYISHITTIHHETMGDDFDEGIIVSLTNVDIEAHERVETIGLEVSIGEYFKERTLERREGIFTAGFSGLPASGEENIRVTAYSEFGELLEQRQFKVTVREDDPEAGTDEYIADVTYAETTYTLYELMADPTLLEGVLENTPVTQLNNIGVTYPRWGGMAFVSTANQLASAISDSTVTMIRLQGDITIRDTLVLDRSVDFQLAGMNHTITGDIQLGEFSDGRTMALYDLTIDGDLVVDVGDFGEAILDNVQVTGETDVLSAGPDSAKMKTFRTPLLKISNEAPMRTSISGSSQINEIRVLSENDITLTIDGETNITTLDMLGLPQEAFFSVNVYIGEDVRINRINRDFSLGPGINIFDKAREEAHISSSDGLDEALEDEDLTTIYLHDDLNYRDDLIIDRTVTVDLNNQQLEVTNVQLNSDEIVLRNGSVDGEIFFDNRGHNVSVENVVFEDDVTVLRKSRRGLNFLFVVFKGDLTIEEREFGRDSHSSIRNVTFADSNLYLYDNLNLNGNTSIVDEKSLTIRGDHTLYGVRGQSYAIRGIDAELIFDGDVTIRDAFFGTRLKEINLESGTLTFHNVTTGNNITHDADKLILEGNFVGTSEWKISGNRAIEGADGVSLTNLILNTSGAMDFYGSVEFLNVRIDENRTVTIHDFLLLRGAVEVRDGAELEFLKGSRLVCNNIRIYGAGKVVFSAEDGANENERSEVHRGVFDLDVDIEDGAEVAFDLGRVREPSTITVKTGGTMILKDTFSLVGSDSHVEVHGTLKSADDQVYSTAREGSLTFHNGAIAKDVMLDNERITIKNSDVTFQDVIIRRDLEVEAGANLTLKGSFICVSTTQRNVSGDGDVTIDDTSKVFVENVGFAVDVDVDSNVELNNVRIDDAIMTIDGGPLTIGRNGLTLDGADAELVLNNSVDVEGEGNAIEGDGKVTINGATVKDLTFDADVYVIDNGAVTFENVTLENATLNLSDDLTIEGTFTLVHGRAVIVGGGKEIVGAGNVVLQNADRIQDLTFDLDVDVNNDVIFEDVTIEDDNTLTIGNATLTLDGDLTIDPDGTVKLDHRLAAIDGQGNTIDGNGTLEIANADEIRDVTFGVEVELHDDITFHEVTINLDLSVEEDVTLDLDGTILDGGGGIHVDNDKTLTVRNGTLRVDVSGDGTLILEDDVTIEGTIGIDNWEVQTLEQFDRALAGNVDAIILGDDIELDGDVDVDREVTIDLNGNTLTYTGFTLEISDAATVQDGNLVTANSVLTISGEATLEDVTVTANDQNVTITDDVTFNNVSVTTTGDFTSDSKITLTGNLEVGAGTTLALSNTGLALEGAFEVNGDGDVEFNGAAGSAKDVTFDLDVNVDAATTFDNVEVATGNTVTVGDVELTLANGLTLTGTAELVLDGATAAIAGAAQTIDGDGTLTITDAANVTEVTLEVDIAVNGNVTFNEVITAEELTIASGVTLDFTGTNSNMAGATIVFADRTSAITGEAITENLVASLDADSTDNQILVTFVKEVAVGVDDIEINSTAIDLIGVTNNGLHANDVTDNAVLEGVAADQITVKIENANLNAGEELKVDDDGDSELLIVAGDDLEVVYDGVTFQTIAAD